MGILEGKKALVFGIASNLSIAYGKIFLHIYLQDYLFHHRLINHILQQMWSLILLQ